MKHTMSNITRKAYAVIMAVVIIISMSACGGIKDSNPHNPNMWVQCSDNSGILEWIRCNARDGIR